MKEIPFIVQDPSRVPVVNQGEGKEGYIDPLADKATIRLDHYQRITQDIIAGKQPEVGSHDADVWYIGQLQEMLSDGYLPEHLGVYIRKPQVTYAQGYNPVSHYYIDDREKLKETLRDPGNGIHDPQKIRVAGDQRGLLEQFRKYDMRKQLASANMTIGIPGDLHGIEEMMHIIGEKMKGRMLDHPLVIENPLNYEGSGKLDQMLRGVKILDFDYRKETPPEKRRQFVDLKALASHYGIYVSENRETTLKLAKELKHTKRIEPINFKSLIPDGSVFFVATGTMKKYDEMVRICKEQGINIKVRSVYELVDTYVGPEEDTHTYQGNVALKMKASFESWQHMSEPRRQEMLRHNFPEITDEELARELKKDGNFLKKKCFFIAEDSGFHFMEPNLVEEEEFRKIRGINNLDAPFPGVETGPNSLGTDGIKGFMKNVEQIFERRKSQGKKIDSRIVSKSLIAIAPVWQQKRDVSMHIISSEIRGHVVFDPKPDGHNSALEIANYVKPALPDGREGDQTEAELGDHFLGHSSPRALAMKAIAQEMQVPLGMKQTIEEDYSKEFKTGIVVDEHSYVSKHQAEQFTSSARAEGFDIQNFSSKFARADALQTEVLSQSDGIIFAFDPERAKVDFWRNLYLFTSMIVAEQTHDKYKFRKPFYLVNPGGAFDYLVDLVKDFNHAGTVAENPSSLYKNVASVEEAINGRPKTDTDEGVTGLKEDRKHYRKFKMPQYATREEPFELEGMSDEYLQAEGRQKDFNVAIFCSASNKNSNYMEGTRQYATSLIHDGFGIVTGGGCYSSMGQITDICDDLRGDPYLAVHKASSSPNIQQKEGDVSKRVTQFQLARNIYERMEYMVKKSDAFTIMVGGTGTVQEFSLLALLKKRAMESEDPYAREMMQDKEIIIINTPMTTDRSRGFYDKLKEIIDENDPEACKKLGIHFVKSKDEALERMTQLRERKREKTGWVPPPGYMQPPIHSVGATLH